MEEALELCGNYVLKTDQTVDAITLWELYMSLLKAEAPYLLRCLTDISFPLSSLHHPQVFQGRFSFLDRTRFDGDLFFQSHCKP